MVENAAISAAHSVTDQSKPKVSVVCDQTSSSAFSDSASPASTTRESLAADRQTRHLELVRIGNSTPVVPLTLVSSEPTAGIDRAGVVATVDGLVAALAKHDGTLVASILAGQDRAHLQEINRVYEEKSSLSFRAHAFPRHESLAEGITQGDMEIQLRNTVSLLSSAEIESVKRSDPKLIASLTTDSNLSAATKEALSIYLGGKDKINTADRLHLADIGIRNNDMRFIEEAFRGSTPADREAFRTTGMASQLEGRFAGTKGKHILERVISGLGVLPGATPLMMLSFDPSLYKDEKREQDSAKSYAAFGKVDAGTQIKHNHSFIYSPNIAGMDRGIASMSDEKKASTKPVMT